MLLIKTESGFKGGGRETYRSSIHLQLIDLSELARCQAAES